ncbi:hypothetical protein J6590_053403, partial [Homalodisca vitripennis]
AEAEEEIDEEQSVILEPKSDDEKLGPGVLVAGTLFLTGKEFPGDAKPIRQNLRRYRWVNGRRQGRSSRRWRMMASSSRPIACVVPVVLVKERMELWDSAWTIGC